MNNMCLAPRFDYIKMLDFLNTTYGNNVKVRFSTTDDTTMEFTTLNGRIGAIALHIGRFSHTVYMINPDTYGFIAENDLIKEHTWEEDTVEEGARCGYHYPDDMSKCNQFAVGMIKKVPYCAVHLLDATPPVDLIAPPEEIVMYCMYTLTNGHKCLTQRIGTYMDTPYCKMHLHQATRTS